MNAYSAGQNDYINAVAWVEDPALGKAVAIAGGSNSFSEDGDLQAWIALISPGGEYIWSNMYEMEYFSSGRSIAPITGPDGLLASIAVGGSYNFNAWMMEVEASDGTSGWQCEYEQFDLIRSVVATSDGQFAFAATTNAPEPCMVIVKTDRSLSNPCGLAWVTVFGEADPSDDIPFSLRSTSDGGFVVAGWTTLFGAPQGIVMKLDSDGGSVWQSTIASSGSHSTEFQDVIEVLDEDGLPDGFVAVGNFGFEGTGANDGVMILTRLAPDDGLERWSRFYGYDALARLMRHAPKGAA